MGVSGLGTFLLYPQVMAFGSCWGEEPQQPYFSSDASFSSLVPFFRLPFLCLSPLSVLLRSFVLWRILADSWFPNGTVRTFFLPLGGCGQTPDLPCYRESVMGSWRSQAGPLPVHLFSLHCFAIHLHRGAGGLLVAALHKERYLRRSCCLLLGKPWYWISRRCSTLLEP